MGEDEAECADNDRPDLVCVRADNDRPDLVCVWEKTRRNVQTMTGSCVYGADNDRPDLVCVWEKTRRNVQTMTDRTLCVYGRRPGGMCRQ
ncbi:hypothetical protein RRG08_037980 [Elysia crispata]|uniref:Uncharacterized protein n=1 Tax=Elysia crispata TaxID=231223 RepID=A0AAE1ACD4_9GAST|nr:hypothetical protein RRG08_037980 [Elysia crispata]